MEHAPACTIGQVPLLVFYNSRIILSKMFTYYSQNYSGIIGAGLQDTVLAYHLKFCQIKPDELSVQVLHTGNGLYNWILLSI